LAAAGTVLLRQNQTLNAGAAASFGAALKTLGALATEHEKLANRKSPDIDAIRAEVNNLKSDISQMEGSSASSSTSTGSTLSPGNK
jgi:hypothetical protein